MLRCKAAYFDFIAYTFYMPRSIICMMYSHVYLLIRMTHLLIKNFFVLNSISMALSISIA